MQPPTELLFPSIDLLGPAENISLCKDFSIKIINQKVSGARNLEVLKWELLVKLILFFLFFFNIFKFLKKKY